MSCLLHWPIGNSYELAFTIRDRDGYVNDAGPGTVTVYEMDEATQVSGTSWPVAATYEAGTNGVYYAVLSENATPTIGQMYRAKMSLSDGVGRVMVGWVDLLAVKRDL